MKMQALLWQWLPEVGIEFPLAVPGKLILTSVG
jgi:hypothetical protein